MTMVPTPLIALLTKARYTSYLIGRVFSRTRAPSPSVALTLVKSILIPQITYGIAFIKLSKQQQKALTQIIANPLRRALGLSPHASASRTLWEFGLTDICSLQLHSLLNIASRSQRWLLSSTSAIPSLLASDMLHYNHVNSPLYITPTPAILSSF